MRRIITLFILILLSLPTCKPVAAADERCFVGVPGINDCISGRFKQYWEQNGGLAVFGYPLTPARMEQTAEGTFLTQYFERQRFELHPENNAPYDVLLGRLGAEIYERTKGDWRSLPANPRKPECLYFNQTNRQVCSPFLEHWRANGLLDPNLDDFGQSLQLFGLPLTEPRLERNPDGDLVLTQWFERARFEDHGTNGVLLGRLGAEIRSITPPPPESTEAEAMLDAINAERTQRGLVALKLNDQLNSAAQSHSNDMASKNFFDHTGSDGSDAGERISRTGYKPRTWAENIAAGYKTPAEVVAAWMNSSGHRANILNADMREIGVGFAQNPNSTYTNYWTVDFAAR